MTGWQVQEMWEMDTNALWEAINAPDPMGDQMIAAAHSMDTAISHISKAEDFLMDAEAELDGSPMAYKVNALYEDLLSIRRAIRELKERYERGER